MGAYLLAYLAAVGLTALTVGLAVSLARASRQRHHQVFLLLVVVNDLVSLSEALLKALPARPGPAVADAAFAAGFVAFPLMAAFCYLALDWFLGLVATPVPGAWKHVFAWFWGLLFVGFLVSQSQYFEHRDIRPERLLKPLFDGAIALTTLGTPAFVLWRSRRVADARERRFVRALCVYFAVAFVAVGLLFVVRLPVDPRGQVLARALLGLAYPLPPLLALRRRFLATRTAPLARVAADPAALDRWLESRGLSPRERQVVRCVLEGKSNAAIGEELFIGLRTVESHLYGVYRKLGVKSRLQLARLAALESAREPGVPPIAPAAP
jgi:DNA-binding CsgD family transcriptional regulator